LVEDIEIKGWHGCHEIKFQQSWIQVFRETFLAIWEVGDRRQRKSFLRRLIVFWMPRRGILGQWLAQHIPLRVKTRGGL
jgi:hypothetical protein